MKTLVLYLVIISLFIFTSESILSQTLKWSSTPRDDSYQRVGWLILKNNPFELRFWQFDYNTSLLVIMDGALSNTTYMNITLLNNEGLFYSQVGQVHYEPNLDFNGDGSNDIITSSNYSSRYGLRIIDITTGQTLFQLDDASYSYDLINAFDYDNDGKLELAIDRRNINTNLSEVQVYSTNGNATSISENIKNIPGIYQLKQNYPNPFNPSTTIRYSLTSPEKVYIKIYNVSGQLLKEISKEHNQAGEFEVIWDGTNKHREKVSSGTYFYQIQAGEFVQAKKMILLK